ncbi:CapA family protein [Undibacterium sp. LX40W]|uniref:CapA family protein n=1 Tax=Undibacterium nitidum TaxID=2762298 RepID=A0A923KLX6_9BURK|nr:MULTISPECIES: CapA family protein [Undibacterium]MBC3882315.1 CapA family protein [Undibacterium nitidum]MBC3892596.1 CapA family protein [Undibacterium sp. LX40W]
MKITTKISIGIICLLAQLAVTYESNAQQSKKGELTLLFAGDIVLDGQAGKRIEEGKDPFDGVRRIFAQADVRVANLECVIATTGDAADKNFTFRAHPRTIAVLGKYVDAVSIANNHSGDFGPEAFAEMLGLLKQSQLPYFGGGYNLKQAHEPLIINKHGYRIALLGYNEFMPRSFEATYDQAGIAWSEDEHVIADIRAARKIHRADFVIPFMHWGWENEMKAGPRQRELARKMIDAGADAVIGGHPHVIQDTEEYKGKPIIYSLGNFMIDLMDNPAQARGWALRLHLKANGVQAWDTQVVNLDELGLPQASNEASACWSRQAGLKSDCKPIAP